MKLRRYGNTPYHIAVIHGGPGAAGEMAPVAEELGKTIGVIEPFQTKDSIEGQIEELKEIVDKKASSPLILIGWSWGAWLAYLFCAEYPEKVKKLILISSGPFDEKYAKNIMKDRLSRLNVNGKKRVTGLIEKLNKKPTKKTMEEFGELISKADSYDALNKTSEKTEVDPDIYLKVWPEAEELRKSRKLLNLAKKITCPVAAIHGDYDPHPAEGVRLPLQSFLKDFKFILLPKCGHHPWLEKYAKDRFYSILKDEIKE
jgi:pimeloyl-ACP methyl ester carboxylesterase